jgi:MFS family permease
VKNQWPPEAIGFALTTATLTSLFSQIPAGAALDSMRDKRRAVLLGIAGVGLAALLRTCAASFASLSPRLGAYHIGMPRCASQQNWSAKRRFGVMNRPIGHVRAGSQSGGIPSESV